MTEEPNVFNRAVPDLDKIQRTFLRTVTCELRFPILLELVDKQPVDFQKSIRDAYPNYARKWEVSLDAGAPPQYDPRYFFFSRDGHWRVVLRPEAVVLETSQYDRFAGLSSRLLSLLGQAQKSLDIPFLTRVGLRFTNAIPINSTLPSGWINPALIKPIEDEVFLSVARYYQEIIGFADAQKGDGFALRHGLEPPNNNFYLLDLDVFRDNVDPEDVAPIMLRLRDYANSLFFWAIGPEALTYLHGVKEAQ